jgi:hypothetical protein
LKILKNENSYALNIAYSLNTGPVVHHINPIKQIAFLLNKMEKKYTFFKFIVLFICANFLFPLPASPQENQVSSAVPLEEKLTMEQAVMSERIEDFAPVNNGVVFSIRIGKVTCFTSFRVVPNKTFIYHKWFHKDKLSTKKRLTLQTPRWSTYSSIQLRETDKGSWRVEICDKEENLLHILRFSITD